MNNVNRQTARIDRFIRRLPPPQIPVQPQITYKNNTILIVCDELINFKYIPEHILKIMPGIQAFKNLGIEFKNIYNNRQDCSPSRGSFCSSQLDITISDNIDQPWQYLYNTELNTSFDTIGKSLKRNGFETVWCGKNHFVSSIAPNVNAIPTFNTNTRGCLKEYGYDIFNTFGDTYYYGNQGMFTDNMTFELKMNYKNNEFDFEDFTGKYIGVLPYLKSRAKNDKSFHLEVHLENPHDTQHFWQNFALKPNKYQLQFWSPYINEQIELLKTQANNSDIKNPFIFSDSFQDAWIKNPNLVKNYFESSFQDYIEQIFSLPFIQSYQEDYILDASSNNSQFPYYIGMMENLKSTSTIPTSKVDIMSWKNLVNNYYGLLLEMDNYIFQLYLELKNKNMLSTTSVMIISDHGDMMSAHGLKQKGYIFEQSCNVACLIYSPNIPDNLRGTKSNILGSLLDVAPTIETLANIKEPSSRFLGKSLFKLDNNKLLPRDENNAVFNIYNSWLTYFTYFNYKNWLTENTENTVITDYNPQSFYDYQAFFTMVVDIINNKQYKLAIHFSVIELLLYNWKYNDKLLSFDVTPSFIVENISQDLKSIPLLKIYIDSATSLVNLFFENDSWNFNRFYIFLNTNTGNNDNLIKTIILTSIISITTSIIEFSYIIPGYYNNDDDVNNFEKYYASNKYYYFMYNLTDDPNELTNLLDKNYTERQTSDVLLIAKSMNDKLNALIEYYNITHFNFIVPQKVFDSFALNLFINNDVIDASTITEFTTCFKLNRQEGETTAPYYDETIRMFSKINA